MSYFDLLQNEKKYLSELKNIYTREQDTKDIEVEHPGILEVPEGKSVEDLGEEHFKALAKKKGWDAISKALMNLVRWNEKKNPSLSSWAHGMQRKLSKWAEDQKED